jgi:hypothetical protein
MEDGSEPAIFDKNISNKLWSVDIKKFRSLDVDNNKVFNPNTRFLNNTYLGEFSVLSNPWINLDVSDFRKIKGNVDEDKINEKSIDENKENGINNIIAMPAIIPFSELELAAAQEKHSKLTVEGKKESVNDDKDLENIKDADDDFKIDAKSSPEEREKISGDKFVPPADEKLYDRK